MPGSDSAPLTRSQMLASTEASHSLPLPPSPFSILPSALGICQLFSPQRLPSSLGGQGLLFVLGAPCLLSVPSCPWSGACCPWAYCVQGSETCLRAPHAAQLWAGPPETGVVMSSHSGQRDESGGHRSLPCGPNFRVQAVWLGRKPDQTNGLSPTSSLLGGNPVLGISGLASMLGGGWTPSEWVCFKVDRPEVGVRGRDAWRGACLLVCFCGSVF